MKTIYTSFDEAVKQIKMVPQLWLADLDLWGYLKISFRPLRSQVRAI